MPRRSTLLFALTLSTTLATFATAQSTVGNANPREFCPLGPGAPTLFFAAATQSQVELYRRPGIGIGPSTPLAMFPIAAGLSGPSELTRTRGGSPLALFAADNGAGFGDELWASNGSLGGTAMVLDIRTGTDGSRPQHFAALASGQTLFVADDGTNGRELWQTDGTGAGTGLVLDIRPGSVGSFPVDLTVVGNHVWFSANDGANGRELWQSNGTAAGTVLVSDIVGGPVGSFPHELTRVGASVMFAADDGAVGTELWSTDIATLATTLVADIRTGPIGSRPRFLTVANPAGVPTLLFAADDGLLGSELWSSDNTGPGTTLVADIRPGPRGSNPHELATDGARLWFAAHDGTHGDEPWTTDVVSFATTLVDDVRLGPDGSMPQQFTTRAAGELLFAADDGATGQELWRVGGAGPANQLADLRPGPCGSGITSLTVDRALGIARFGADPGGGSGHELFLSNGTPGGTVATPQINPSFDNQPALDIEHLLQSGQINNTFKMLDMTPGASTFLMFGGRPGPPIDLTQFLMVPSVGALTLDPAAFAIALGPVTADNDGVARFQGIDYPITNPAFEILAQGLGFDGVELKLTDNMALCQGTLDLSGIGCPPGTTVELFGEYVDDRLDYCLVMMPSSPAVTWVVFVKIFADGSCKEILRVELTGDKTSVTLVKSLKLGERIEARFYCGKPNDDCSVTTGYVPCRLGC